MTHLSDTRDMPVPDVVNDNSHDWLDGRFLRGLLQRGQQPGLIRWRQAQSIQARMAHTAFGFPLAATLQKRFAATATTDAAALPVVFVQPQPSTLGQTPDTTVPLTPPIIPTPALVSPNLPPLISETPVGAGIHKRGTVSDQPDTAKTEPTQRLSSGITSGAMSPSLPLRHTETVQAPLSPSQPFHSPASEAITPSPPAAHSPAAPRVTSLPVATPIIQRAIAPPDNENEDGYKRLKALPLFTATKTAANRNLPTGLLPFSSGPSLENEPARISPPLPLPFPLHRNDASPLPPFASHSTGKTDIPPATGLLPVVHPQEVVTGANGGDFRSELPLARPAAAASVIQRTPASPALARTASTSQPSLQTNQPQVSARNQSAVIQRVPTDAPVAAASNPDLEQMAAKMQRRLLRHLEIEAERRGVKPWR